MRWPPAAAAVLLTAACGATTPVDTSRADPGDAILADFHARIDRYMELREEAADEVPDADETRDPADIRARELLLAAQIRARRLRAAHGDIFTPEIRTHFRRLLRPVLHGDQREAIEDTLEGDAPAPGAVPIEVNARYPAGVPFPTTPPPILFALPPLPAGLEYRIIGRDLILLDQPADVVLDYIRNVMPQTPKEM